MLFIGNYYNAQQFVYKPVNPAFGGDTFNYQWLLSSANAQNQFDNDKDKGFNEKSAIASFNEDVNRQILNQLSRNLFGTDFGSSSNLQPGSYTLGNLYINILRSNSCLYVSILDTQTGEQTEIIIP